MRCPLLFFLLVTLFFSCQDDTVVDPIDEIEFIPGGGFFIGNEGNFNAGNASVYYYAFAKEAIRENVFQSLTNQPLGDVLQSMTLYNDLIYLVVNNSQKVEIVRAPDFASQGRITGLTSPRYLLPVSSKKAFLTDLYANHVFILDLENQVVTDSIPTPYWTEELEASNDRIFVSQRFSDKVLVIDRYTDLVIDSIAVGYDPSATAKDQNGAIWVLCGGSETQQGGIYRINPFSLQVEQSLPFDDPITDLAPRLITNESGDRLYYLAGGCYEVPITAESLPAAPIIPGDNHQWYALGWEPELGHILLGDAIDYQQKGLIYRYLPDGTLVDSSRVGLIPNFFLPY